MQLLAVPSRTFVEIQNKVFIVHISQYLTDSTIPSTFGALYIAGERLLGKKSFLMEILTYKKGRKVLYRTICLSHPQS